VLRLSERKKHRVKAAIFSCLKLSIKEKFTTHARKYVRKQALKSRSFVLYSP
jgi:hypothetical protein